MKITYDKDVDALYVELVDGRHYRSVRLTDDVVLDFMGEELAGIEILGLAVCSRRTTRPSS